MWTHRIIWKKYYLPLKRFYISVIYELSRNVWIFISGLSYGLKCLYVYINLHSGIFPTPSFSNYALSTLVLFFFNYFSYFYPSQCIFFFSFKLYIFIIDNFIYVYIEKWWYPLATFPTPAYSNMCGCHEMTHRSWSFASIMQILQIKLK